MVKLRGKLNDGEAGQYVRHYVDISGDAPERRALERLWFVNKAYYMGAQYIVLDDGRLRVPRRKGKSRTHYQANKILPKVIKALAKLSSNNTDFVVAPKSGDFEDVLAADTSLKVWEWIKQSTKYRSKMRRATLEAALCGTGWLKVTFDPLKGTPNRIYTNPDGSANLQPEFNPELRQRFEQAGAFVDDYPGEIDIDVPSTFNVYWDPNARSGGVDDCAWMSQVNYVPIEDLIDKYGDLGFKGDDYERGAQLYEENVANLASGLQGFSGLGTWAKSQIGSRARVVELFERPLPRNDMQGRYILLAGNVLVRNEANPYAASGNPLPFVKVDWFPVEGRFIGLSLVEQLRPSQKAYNKARSHSIQYQQTYGNAPVWMPKNSAVKAVSLTSVPGQVFEYDTSGGAVPQFGQTPKLPDYVLQNAVIASEEMDEISGQASPAKNAMPAGVRSGAAIQLVQAENNSMLTPVNHANLEATEECGTMCLQLAGLHYDRPRVAQIVGDFGDIETLSFMGTDLRGHYSLKLRAEPTPLESREAYKQTLLDAISARAIQPETNPAHQSLVMRALRFNDEQGMLDVITRQQLDEERIIMRMLREDMYVPKPQPFHDPTSRLPVLEHFMNGSSFERLNGMVQQKFLLRWKDFKNQLAQLRQAEMEAAQSQQGAPGPKGAVSQPAPRG
tara:strand:+ start:2274 stop:4295 length:2022 start_codon:yes stop_codon:yes gene_type:complete